jgi:hypothetical protein
MIKELMLGDDHILAVLLPVTTFSAGLDMGRGFLDIVLKRIITIHPNN